MIVLKTPRFALRSGKKRTEQTLPQPSLAHEFTDAEADQIAEIAQRQGWDIAVHDCMRSLNHRAYRVAIDEYRSQIRFLLPMTADSHVLNLRSDWGSVAFNLAANSGFVVAMDDRPTRSRFLAARQSQMDVQTLHPLCGGMVPNLPFVDEAFDAVIMLDALEHVKAAAGSHWKTAQHSALAEVTRVLKKGGCALLGISNRFGIARPPTSGLQHSRTYWGYRQALHKAGFSEARFYAALPSHREPFFILPLDGAHALNFFVHKIFTAQDYRSKLQAQGLGSAYRLAFVLRRLAHHLGFMKFARYFVPTYLILAQK
jgi:ubiquinone/menaquinone biosynthesis C-methylase UbiE